MNIIETIHKNDPDTNVDIYIKFTNEMFNFSKFVEKIFVTELFKNKEISTTFKQFKNGKNIFWIHL